MAGGGPAHRREEMWELASFGVFLVAVGFTWAAHPSLPGELVQFIRDLRPVTVGNVVIWGEPSGPHPLLYRAVGDFFAFLGAWGFLLVALRLLTGSTLRNALRSIPGAILLCATAAAFWMLETGSLAFRTLPPLIILFAGISLTI